VGGLGRHRHFTIERRWRSRQPIVNRFREVWSFTEMKVRTLMLLFPSAHHEHRCTVFQEPAVSWDVILGYFTGLRFLSPHIEPTVLLRTTVLVHICDGIMCRVFAHNSGYSKKLWTALGLVFGIWAVAVLIVLPPRARPNGP